MTALAKRRAKAWGAARFSRRVCIPEILPPLEYLIKVLQEIKNKTFDDVSKGES